MLSNSDNAKKEKDDSVVNDFSDKSDNVYAKSQSPENKLDKGNYSFRVFSEDSETSLGLGDYAQIEKSGSEISDNRGSAFADGEKLEHSLNIDTNVNSYYKNIDRSNGRLQWKKLINESESIFKGKLFGKKTTNNVENQTSDLANDSGEILSSDMYLYDKDGEVNLFGILEKKRKSAKVRSSKSKYRNGQSLANDSGRSINREKYFQTETFRDSQSYTYDNEYFYQPDGVKSEYRTNNINKEVKHNWYERIIRCADNDEQVNKHLGDVFDFNSQSAKVYEAEDAYAISHIRYRKKLKLSLFSLFFIFLILAISTFVLSKRYNFFSELADPFSIYRQRRAALMNQRNDETAQKELKAIRELLLDNDNNKRGNLAGEDKGLFIDDTKVNENFDRSRISSESIYLYNLSDDVPVFAWKSELSLDPGAITQIFTSSIYMSYLKNPLKETQVPSEIVFYLYDQNARQSGFAPGEKCYMIDFAYGSILAGATDCAMAEAYYVAGNQSDFVDMMNEEARALGLKNTHFANASGLPSDNHYSSAEDIAVFFKKVYQDPRMMKILKSVSHISMKTDFRKDGLFIENSVLKYYKENPISGVNIIAGRSGSNPDSGRSLVTISEKNGKTYLLVTLGAKKYGRDTEASDHFEDHKVILSEFLK